MTRVGFRSRPMLQDPFGLARRHRPSRAPYAARQSTTGALGTEGTKPCGVSLTGEPSLLRGALGCMLC